MHYRLCGLTLAVFLSACSGGSDSEPEKAPSSFTPQVTVVPKIDAPTPGSAVFSYGPEDGISRSSVSEEPASKSQKITVKGIPVQFTASAGHLISTGSIPIGTGLNHRDADAAIFYTAYTRDDLPKENRPVTFVFNGGPGGASAALDLGFLGPKSYDDDASDKAKTLLWKDNPNTILDKTDLVFVDPVGTGYSEAIWPNKNEDFWGVDSDAKVLRSFITRYINANNRQSSPKYIYGVSYGGFRVPIIAQLLIEKGESGYLPDPSKKPAKVLSGLILNSPILDINSDCSSRYVSCHGVLPTYAMVKAFHDKSVEKPDFDLPAFLGDARLFAVTFNNLYKSVFKSVDQKISDRSQWNIYLQKPESEVFLNRLYKITGIGKLYKLGEGADSNPWIANPNMDSREFVKRFSPQETLQMNDGRYFLEKDTVDPVVDRTDVNYDHIKSYLAGFADYKAKSRYLGSNGKIILHWNYMPDQHLSVTGDRFASAIPDLTFDVTLNPNLKVLIQHGYYDLNTPFHKTEVDIENANLSSRIPIKTYLGGHGIGPGRTDGYEKVLAELDAFYDQPAVVKLAAFNAALPEARNP
ncbi:S10 family serine carboxypeptidase-like protein [Phyllobacterium ifriqiyense]|uniref:S10 family serine carboxypeptidase-like protein n=1 Tax=Phyllobacterium ifriqiyense TaxID=314238 RepID=UPI003395EA9D